jgi:hypothetical protein
MEEFPPPVRILRSLLAGVLLFAVTLVIVSVFFPPSAASMPLIVPESSRLQSPPVEITHTFRFEDTSVTVSVPVNYSVYAGAKKVERTVFVIHNGTTTEAELYRSMVNDPSQEALFSDLLGQFRAVRTQRNLSDDEYLELMTVYVQSLPYTVIADAPAKYPIETVMDKTGDCDDKSLLLAGLLAREGYPVVLFLFGPEKHMALGISSDAFLYKSTGYAYVEATNYSFVGVPSYTMNGNGTLVSDPRVIGISNGTKRYHAARETQYIDTMSSLAGRKAAALSLKLRGTPVSAAENRTEYLAEFSRLDHYSAVHNYVIAHKYDRPGVYAYLKQEMANDTA